MYLVDGPSGPTTAKLNDTIAYNFILAKWVMHATTEGSRARPVHSNPPTRCTNEFNPNSYHSSMAIDNDDGSAYYDTHHNVYVDCAQQRGASAPRDP